MELLIRSQDKWTLTTTKSVYVRFPDEKRASIFNQDNINIGQYSWERALEVLDEIQRLLIGKRGMITTQDKKGIEFIPFIDTLVVYEMPKE